MTIEEDVDFISDLGLRTWRIDFGASDSSQPGEADRHQVPLEHANACSSTRPDGTHAILLDLDAVLHRLVPSSTPGHSHLILGTRATWGQCVSLLGLLAEMGVIEPGYASLSIERGEMFLRLPGVKKEKPVPDPVINEPMEAPF